LASEPFKLYLDQMFQLDVAQALWNEEIEKDSNQRSKMGGQKSEDRSQISEDRERRTTPRVRFLCIRLTIFGRNRCLQTKIGFYGKRSSLQNV
jgi:hypothetical protein